MRPRRAEPSIQRGDHSAEFLLRGFQSPHLGACTRHRSEPHDVGAGGACPQVPMTACELRTCLLEFVGEISSEKGRLFGIGTMCRSQPGLPNSHGCNLTAPLGSCHMGHMIVGTMI